MSVLTARVKLELTDLKNSHLLMLFKIFNSGTYYHFTKEIGNCTNLIKIRFCALHLHFAKWMHYAVEIFWQELRMKGKLQNTLNCILKIYERKDGIFYGFFLGKSGLVITKRNCTFFRNLIHKQMFYNFGKLPNAMMT